MLKLTNRNFEKEIADGLTMVIFGTNWCGFCKMLEPIAEEFSIKHENVKVGKVDADSEKELADLYKVDAYPTIIIFKDGRVTDKKMSGMQSIESLENMIA
ncbi:MAG: protein disulfide isomerase family protein [Oscillospiraceae bacterium]|nr:protein disulfide isomerase family protein [Oscillospiraceae bacterium]